jgi:penicillin-binding protein 1C
MKDVTQRRALFDAEILPPIEVCPLSGLPAGDACPDRVMRRHIPHEHASEGHCTLHRHATRAASKWRCDARGRDTVVLLPEVFAPWLRSQPVGAPGRDPAGLPWLSASDTMGCDVAPALAELRIDDPVAGTVLVASRAGSVELAASVIGSAPFEVEYVLDGQVVARVGPPYRALVAATAGDHVLVARPADPHAAVRLAESRFSVR